MKTAATWYDPATTLSHNLNFNMVMSARGGGKTFGMLKHAVNQFIKNRSQFVYLRRTETELDSCKDQLMNAIIHENVFPGREFKVIGNDVFMGNEQIGFCIALSTSFKMKSVAFPRVGLIIYDEFLLEDSVSRYLPREPEKLLSLYETVARQRNNVKLVMLANYVSKSNPYFDYFRIYPREQSTFTKHPELPLLLHFWRSSAFREMKEQTQFAKLISGTAYGKYLLDNLATRDNYTFIEPLPELCTYRATIKWDGKEIGVYYSNDQSKIYFSHKIDPSATRVYAFDLDDHGPNVLLLKRARQADSLIKDMRFAIEYGLARFSNLTIKNAMLGLLNYI